MEISDRIAAVQRQLEADNPGFAEHLSQQPTIPEIDIDTVIAQTDTRDIRSVARAYFLFALNEFNQRNSGTVSCDTMELIVELFEDSMIGNPAEQMARHRALVIGDSIECSTGSTVIAGDPGDQHEVWGASIARLHDFERRLFKISELDRADALDTGDYVRGDLVEISSAVMKHRNHQKV